MCLIVWAWKQHPTYKLVLAANRDEFYARPTEPAHYWPDAPNLLAGRDTRHRGTWMGITRDGRFAAVTNYREGFRESSDAPSRGHLTTSFLEGSANPQDYARGIAPQASSYNGYNLLLSNFDDMVYTSNRTPEEEVLAPGLYGLSNHLINTPWPKVSLVKAGLADALESREPDPDALFDFMLNADRATDEQLPDTGIPIQIERELSSAFIALENYGTRCSTVVLVDYDNQVQYIEKQHAHAGRDAGVAQFSFQVGLGNRD